MAQNVTIMGASYPDVPAVELPRTGGGMALFADPSVTTAQPEDVAAGKIFLNAQGEPTEGTGSGGGGSSDWELVDSKEITVNTTSTAATEIEWWDTGKPSIFTAEKMLYIRIRDKAGKRNGYFYGSDTFLVNPSVGTTSNVARLIYRCDTNGTYYAYNGAYGIYVTTIEDTGSIRLVSRYSKTYSLTINGIYTVEVYLLSPPTGKPFFT